MKERIDVAVVGAGLGGLSAALLCAQGGRRVVLCDPHRTGGRAATDDKEGFLLNRGPHALYETGDGLKVLRRLGIEAEGASPPIASSRGWFGDRTQLLASPRTLGVTAMARLAHLYRAISKADPASHSHETMAEWLDANDAQGCERQVVEAIVRTATYTHALDLLSADVALAQTKAGFAGVRYLHGGWGSMVSSLWKRADEVGVTHSPHRVTRVEMGDTGHLVESEGATLCARTIVVAAGTAAAAAQVLNVAPSTWPLDAAVGWATCLDLGLRRPPRHRVVLGIDRPIYAITHHPPARLAPDGGAVTHLMRTIHPHEDLSTEAGQADLDSATSAIGVSEGDIVVRRRLHRMMAVSALSTPESGGAPGRPGVRVPGVPSAYVVGDWVGPGWLADASLRSASDASAAIMGD